jgi:hypothetical protein
MDPQTRAAQLEARVLMRLANHANKLRCQPAEESADDLLYRCELQLFFADFIEPEDL